MDLRDIISAKFPSLSSFIISEISEYGTYKEINADTIVMNVGDRIKQIPLLISGSLKIVRTNENGQELLLYYLYAGNSCALSLSCCQIGKQSEIKASTEEESEIIFVPAQLHEKWMREDVSWQNLVFNTYQNRFNELLEVLDEVAFHKLDERLISYLSKKAELSMSNNLHLTHAQIAIDLNTSREVISRLLKQMQKKGILELARNNIKLKSDFNHYLN